MNKLLLSICCLSTSILGYSQYCMTGGPSSEIDSNLEWLTLVGSSGVISFTGCNGPTQGVTGVEEYLTQTAYIDAGSNYSVSLQFGTCGGNYPGNGQAWIDFNINGVFEPGESIGTWTGTPPTASSIFNFTVPAGATTGQSRMRVMQAESSSLPLDPCASFAWGSVTDFSVFIQNGVDCSSYIGDDETDPRIVASIPFSETFDNSVCYTNQNPVYFSPDVYYLVTPSPTTAALNISLCGSAFDTFLSVMDTQGNIIAINDDHPDCGTSSKLQVSTIGHDSLYIIVEGWGVESGSYTISIDEETLGTSSIKEMQVGLYPNPANDHLTVKSQFNGEFTIIDMHGNVVLEDQFASGQKFNIEGIVEGMYLIKVSTEEGMVTQKLVIR